MTEQAIYQRSNKNTSLRQGEILTNVTQYNVDPAALSSEQPDISLSVNQITHPYAIVVTQDCDLDWDYKARAEKEQSKPDKFLNSVILCEISKAEEVRKSGNNMNRKEWELVSTQRHERFYFLEKIDVDYELQQQGLPELTVDFKRVFAIEAATLYYQLNNGMTLRRAILCSPYLEHFSRRYYSFHGRVALPAQYESEKEGTVG
ncbi:hypothetical protein [Microcoleus asticus]|uniref:Uncharacterized protein n=1 Tax=Microcoleus asticus IPMA8 TaxID=2563858 RepID=A0ABX2CXP5_9CYAN|nr:hypothetical protein [Microcoleus asticus]NQE35189.1 hypothetical protein [Microcoleus asticus IPMA8]